MALFWKIVAVSCFYPLFHVLTMELIGMSRFETDSLRYVLLQGISSLTGIVFGLFLFGNFGRLSRFFPALGFAFLTAILIGYLFSVLPDSVFPPNRDPVYEG
ncbi:MAG: hypothetical protein AAF733_10010 [Verrucomicrobiota bacterium]